MRFPCPRQRRSPESSPKESDLQLFRLEKLHEFQCLRCRGSKKSKTVAVQGGDWSKLLCNACYGLLQSKKG